MWVSGVRYCFQYCLVWCRFGYSCRDVLVPGLKVLHPDDGQSWLGGCQSLAVVHIMVDEEETLCDISNILPHRLQKQDNVGTHRWLQIQEIAPPKRGKPLSTRTLRTAGNEAPNSPRRAMPYLWFRSLFPKTSRLPRSHPYCHTTDVRGRRQEGKGGGQRWGLAVQEGHHHVQEPGVAAGAWVLQVVALSLGVAPAKVILFSLDLCWFYRFQFAYALVRPSHASTFFTSG